MAEIKKRTIWLPDMHIPYEDERAVDLVLDVIADYPYDRVIIQGDMLDCPQLSTFDVDPDAWDWSYDLSCANEFLDRLQRAAGPKAKIIYLEGNHEYRLPKYLLRNAPALKKLVSVPRELRLRERGIQWVKYRDDIRAGKIYNTHDTGRYGKNAVLQTLEMDYQHNMTIGHVHRMDYHIRGNAAGEKHVGAAFGWLGDVTQLGYMHRVKAAREWTLGFGEGYELGNGVTHVVPIPIIDYKCVVAGDLWEG